MKNYPEFPYIPVSCGMDFRKDWTKKEGHECFNWFIAIFDQRASTILDYFEEDINQESNELLLRLGKKLVKALEDEKCWRETEDFEIKFRTGHTTTVNDGRGLTKYGYSIAADMGCLLALLLLRDLGDKIKWGIVTKPKNDMFFLHPVLEGFAIEFEPVHVSVVLSLRVIRGRGESEAWAKIYAMQKEELDNC